MLNTPRFPPVEQALTEPDGLLALGGFLTPAWLMAAYEQGIFPWFNEGEEILWWAPSKRMVLEPSDFYTSRRLAKRMRTGKYAVTFNQNFAAVIQHCAQVHGPSWITSSMQEAYIELHQLGWGKSVEVWLENKLVGGLYGVQLGAIFFAESMFHLATDASKIALHHLCLKLLQEFPAANASASNKAQQLPLIDCQFYTDHLASLGAKEISRLEFMARLKNRTSKL